MVVMLETLFWRQVEEIPKVEEKLWSSPWCRQVTDNNLSPCAGWLSTFAIAVLILDWLAGVCSQSVAPQRLLIVTMD